MMSKNNLLFTIAVLAAVLLSPFTLYSQIISIEPVGEWGSGNTRDVAVSGNYAYCATSGNRMEIIDISNLTGMKKVGHYSHAGGKRIAELCVKGTRAYLGIEDFGLQVVDISDKTGPVLLGELFVPAYSTVISDITVENNIVCLLFGVNMSLFDVSDPTSPLKVGNYNSASDFSKMYRSGNYLYLNNYKSTKESGFEVVDISTPSAPVLVTSFKTSGFDPRSIHVHGNYVYTAGKSKVFNQGALLVVDVSTLSAPTLAGSYETVGFIYDLAADGNHIYAAVAEPISFFRKANPSVSTSSMSRRSHPTGRAGGVGGTTVMGLEIVDVSNPAAPTFAGALDTTDSTYDLAKSGDTVYLGAGSQGLLAVDVSSAAAPSLSGQYSEDVGGKAVFAVQGDYAYVVKGVNAYVVDISDPSSPFTVGRLSLRDRGSAVIAKGNYLYVGLQWGVVEVVDISSPTLPVTAGYTDFSAYALGVTWLKIKGNYLYVCTNGGGVLVCSITVPTSPQFLGQFSEGYIHDFDIKGGYIYLVHLESSSYRESFDIFDASSPASPVRVGSFSSDDDDNFIGAESFEVTGNYAYVRMWGNLWTLDISDRRSPAFLTRTSDFSISQGFVGISGDYLFVLEDSPLLAYDISDRSKPVYLGSYLLPVYSWQLYVEGSRIYASNSGGQLNILDFSVQPATGQIALNRDKLYFAALKGGDDPGAQTVFLSISGGGNYDWTVSTNQPWLSCSPGAGIGNKELTISVDTGGVNFFTVSGTVTVTCPLAVNSPQTVEVGLALYNPGTTSVPFGAFESPDENDTLSGSAAFSGWVLDDIGVDRVELFLENNGNPAYIGEAALVDDARPDVEQLYPAYPMSYRAGWGYMLLTNYLPGGGNGTYRIHAVATDLEQNQVTLGTKTVTCDNANAVLPFGTIDLPGQGGTVSGGAYRSVGWVLTPMPSKVPEDGSTIEVFVDGALQGTVQYNLERSDVAALFPGYANSGRSGAVFSLDTTAFTNGVHTIYWVAADNAGNANGIGSRYFSVFNTGTTSAGNRFWPSSLKPVGEMPVNPLESLRVKRGWGANSEDRWIDAGTDGWYRVESAPLERLEITVGGQIPVIAGYLLVGNRLRPLPVGSSLNIETGVFRWSPGPGFSGEYRLIFLEKEFNGTFLKKQIGIHIGKRKSG